MSQIKWLEEDDPQNVIYGFHKFCGLHPIHGAIDAVKIHIMKWASLGQNALDYYSY